MPLKYVKSLCNQKYSSFKNIPLIARRNLLRPYSKLWLQKVAIKMQLLFVSLIFFLEEQAFFRFQRKQYLHARKLSKLLENTIKRHLFHFITDQSSSALFLFIVNVLQSDLIEVLLQNTDRKHSHKKYTFSHLDFQGRYLAAGALVE